MCVRRRLISSWNENSMKNIFGQRIRITKECIWKIIFKIPFFFLLSFFVIKMRNLNVFSKFKKKNIILSPSGLNSWKYSFIKKKKKFDKRIGTYRILHKQPVNNLWFSAKKLKYIKKNYSSNSRKKIRFNTEYYIFNDDSAFDFEKNRLTLL